LQKEIALKEVRQMDTRLKDIEFDLLYLGLLTNKKVKPLSRWERKLEPMEIEALKSMGLKIRSIKRYLESGQIFEELIFSENKELIDVYANAFMEKPINNSYKTALLEGKLFGYPECCVRSFVSRGYLPNGFNMADQRILFHWACPNCHVTPKLLPQYRKAYEEARLIQRGYPLKKLKNRQVARIIPLVGLASCILVIGCEHKSITPSGKPDIHWISVENDLDKDYLKDEWEKHLGLDPSNPDTDGDSVLDGVQLAKRLCSQIQNPPEWIRIDDNKMFGLYVCSKCGQAVNMGFMEITNTRKGTSICVDYLSLHYMEHGSLAYEGKEGISGVVDAIQLDSILSDIPPGKPDIHWISIENDSDDDYLKDEWEKHLGLDPSKADTDGDGVLDGVQLAKRLCSQIQNPPEWIKIDDHWFKGLYTCSKCGETVNMGYIEITNTSKNASIMVDYLALHYLEHGSLAYEGKEGISGIVDAIELDSTLSK
jgi:DNA-directed RNA polymerase subunit RPC12/RpoP